VRLNGKKPKDKAYPREVKTIGDAIRKRRLDLGLLQRDVAKIVGCDETSVLNWEKGHTTPGATYIPGVLNFLGHNPFELIAVRSDSLLFS
jgi:transcriptional regulator with XRE-family HTH domain